jgi:hypothetical protein
MESPISPVTAYLKRWTTLRAIACRAGIQTFRTDPADGPIRFVSLRHGVPRLFDDLDAVERYVREACAAGIVA